MKDDLNHEITKIFAEEVKDSRGNPTLKVTVTAGNASGSFSVPSGASTGVSEAHELRDEDGRGVKRAIEIVNKDIAQTLVGQNILAQSLIDGMMIELDGTANKDRLGGNSMIGVSIACAKAAAQVSGKEVFEYLRTLADIKPSREVPYLYMNMIEGGKHAKDGLAFQEYLVVPNAKNAEEAVQAGIKVQNSLKEIILKKLGENSVKNGDEGGFAPEISNILEPFHLLRAALKENELDSAVRFAIDAAASSFYENDSYRISGKVIPKEDLGHIYEEAAAEFDLLSIEDPFDEKDFADFAKLKERIPGMMIVGDDLTTTNKKLLENAIKDKSINAMIIKPNQIGTLTETLETMRLARENGIELIVSHRSGETDDDFIADLAYAFGCFGLKAGSPQKPERMVKYKRLIEITNK